MELFKLLGTVAVDNNKAIQAINETASHADSLAGRMAASFKSVGEKSVSLGKKMLPISTAVGGVGIAAGKMYLKFEDSMSNISTLLDDDSHLKTYETAIKKTSNATGLALDDMSAGMYQAISSLGDGGEETTKIFDTMAKSAKAGGAEVSDSVALISAGMKGYNDVSEKTAKKISDLAFQTAKLGVTTFPEMAKSMQPLFPLANSLNLSYEDLFGSMATLTGVTGNTAEVSTQLKAVFSNLMTPTTQMQGLIEKYGYSSGQAMLESEGFAGMLKIVQKETGGQADKMAELFSSVEAVTAMTALTGSQFDTFNNKLGQMSDATGAADKAYEKLNNRGDKIRKTWNTLKNTMVEFGATVIDMVTPYINALSKSVSKLNDWYTNLTKSQKKVITTIAGIVTAAAPVLIIFGKLSTGIGRMITLSASVVRSFQQAQVTLALFTATSNGATIAQGLFNGQLTIGETLVGLFTGKVTLAEIATALWAKTQAALNVVMSANPITLVAGAAAALAVVFAGAVLATRHQSEETKKLNADLKELDNTVSEYDKNMKSLADTRKKSIAEGVGEMNYYQGLSRELESVVDSNGRVKKGYEDRASFIVSTLNEALGLEISMNNGVIEGYGKIGRAIDDVIEKKKAQIILEAHEAEYKAAVKERATLLDGLAVKQRALTKAEEERITFLQNGGSKEDAYYATLQANLGKAQSSYDKYAKKVQGNSNTITNYEKMTADVQKKHYSEVINHTGKLSDKYIDLTKMTKKELTAQRNATKEKLDSINTYYKKSGDKTVLATRDAHKKQLADIDKQLAAMGTKIKSDTKSPNAAKELGKKVNSALDKKLDGEKSGKNLAAGVGKGIGKGLGGALSAVGSFASSVLAKMRDTFEEHSPSKATERSGVNLALGIINGLSKKKKAVLNASKKHLGESIAKGLVSGIENSKANAKKKASEISNLIIKEAKNRLEKGRTYKKMNLVDEVEYWDAVRKQCKKGTKAKLEADKQYLAAKKKLAAEQKKVEKQLVEDAEKRLDKYKTYNNMSLKDEMEYWDKIRKAARTGTEARLEADKRYFEAKQNYNEQLIQAEKDYSDAVNAANQKIEDRTNAILSAFNLFDQFTQKVDEENPITSDTLMNNLQSQVDALAEWQKNINDLQGKIGDTELFKVVQEMGVSSLQQVKAINAMTEEQLAKYVELYNQRQQQAKEQATAELGGEVLDDINKAMDTYQKTLESLDTSTKKKFGNIASTIKAKTKEAATVTVEKLQAMLNSFAAGTKGMDDVTKTKFDNILSKIQSNMKSAVATVQSAVAQMQAALASVGAAETETTVTATANVSKHAKGGVLTEPTIFGYSPKSNTYHLGGEAGAEAIAPIDVLQGYVSDAVAKETAEQVGLLQRINTLLEAILAKDTAVYLNSKEISRAVNRDLGVIL